ncbi:MAG TPA: hypothetical protein VNI20_08395 [Fimbriimonadaceae bacterium]|nr:hypothetical protein [Fimbriimonadaceae bacterium]
MVSCLLVASMLMAKPAEYKILFIGNSLTANNNVPAMVKSLLASAGNKVETSQQGAAHLDDAARNSAALNRIKNGGWTHVVLQGAMISTSHKYEYSQQPGIDLAKAVTSAGAKLVLFAEWPRRGIDESDYIYKHYQMIQKGAGAGVISPVCYAWDANAPLHQTTALWTADGNHATPIGSFIAACALAYTIGGPDSKFAYVPPGLSQDVAKGVMEKARSAVKAHVG